MTIIDDPADAFVVHALVDELLAIVGLHMIKRKPSGLREAATAIAETAAMIAVEAEDAGEGDVFGRVYRREKDRQRGR